MTVSHFQQPAKEEREHVESLHCLSAFGSVVTFAPAMGSRFGHPHVSIAFRRLVQSSLAGLPSKGQSNKKRVSIAFRRLVQSSPPRWLCRLLGWNWSPLPFGVWFSRHTWDLRRLEKKLRVVSIAFRRLVQSSLAQCGQDLSRRGGSLHCLSAFGSVVTHWPTLHALARRLTSPLPFGVWFSRHAWCRYRTVHHAKLCLHCLSAFGSVVTRPPSLSTAG